MLRSILSCACGFSITLLGSAGAAPPEDPVGTWKLKCIPPDGKPRHCVVTVFRDGRALKGTYTAEGVTRPVEGIAFDRGEVCIRVNGEFADRTYRLTYRGRPAGDTLAGSVRWSYGILGGTFAFEGERIGRNVTSTGAGVGRRDGPGAAGAHGPLQPHTRPVLRPRRGPHVPRRA